MPKGKKAKGKAKENGDMGSEALENNDLTEQKGHNGGGGVLEGETSIKVDPCLSSEKGRENSDMGTEALEYNDLTEQIGQNGGVLDVEDGSIKPRRRQGRAKKGSNGCQKGGGGGVSDVEDGSVKPRRRRGRPKKGGNGRQNGVGRVLDVEDGSVKPRRRRGRPKKSSTGLNVTQEKGTENDKKRTTGLSTKAKKAKNGGLRLVSDNVEKEDLCGRSRATCYSLTASKRVKEEPPPSLKRGEKLGENGNMRPVKEEPPLKPPSKRGMKRDENVRWGV
ncbi:hypothetical protein U1Q18_029836 [Sarracenia purpurea var. burkii]